MKINNENTDLAKLPLMLENFSRIREKAMEYIQQTATGRWTDHNLHDPGITIMEAVSYALADLGFRMNFPMQDILADENAQLPEHGFYYADQILPSHPVTIRDYRKILLDIPNVRNAWVYPLLDRNSPVKPDYEPVYILKMAEKLVVGHELTGYYGLSVIEANQVMANNRIFICGLYSIHIEFDSDPVWGNIDSGEAFESIYKKDHFGDMYYDISNWTDMVNNPLLLRELAEAFQQDRANIQLELVPSEKNKYNNSDGKLDERVLKEWYWHIDIYYKGVKKFRWEHVLFQPYFENDKGISGKDLKSILTNNGFAFFNACFQRIVALDKVYDEVMNQLRLRRNLCEDFLPGLAAIPAVELRVCADIDVESRVDIEQVQAEIFNKIEEYISPTSRFYTYQEMLAKGKSVEEILEGPILEHGFLLDEEMGPDSWQDVTLHVSDIVNAIYETEGLLNCRNLQVFLMDQDGIRITNDDKWTIPVPSGFKPRLNKRKSKLIFYKNDLPLTANFREAIQKLEMLKAGNSKWGSSEVPRPDLKPVYRNLALHYTIADEFPATYKIGRYFPDEYTQKPELFSSKQLEGYLLLFDQLMANFLKDLDELKDTLSWKQVQHVLHTSTNNEWRREYLLDLPVSSKWQQVVESKEEFVKRRNRVLDYLLSRFSEDLHEIDNYFYQATDNLAISQVEYYKYLIRVKQDYLRNYISISANRGAGIEAFLKPTYNETIPGGFELRLSQLLGCKLMIGGKRRRVADINTPDKYERGYFHIIEHILLRIPKLPAKVVTPLEMDGIRIELPGICADDDCTACNGDDPYSFTASVILPAWLPVYEDVRYRDFVERLIRKEAPAGVLLRICWIDKVSMLEFEIKLEDWWTARNKLLASLPASYNSNLIEFIKKSNEFITVLKKQRSEYFPATLHGCEDEGEENNGRVFLDKTFLGKPKK
jgi:hypothetical protein